MQIAAWPHKWMLSLKHPATQRSLQ